MNIKTLTRTAVLALAALLSIPSFAYAQGGGLMNRSLMPSRQGPRPHPRMHHHRPAPPPPRPRVRVVRTTTTKAPALTGAQDGILFKDYPYTILSVPALSLRDSAEGVFDHTLLLRFHRDSKQVDIKVLTPGQTDVTWNNLDERATYTTESALREGASDEEKDIYDNTILHYVDNGTSEAVSLQIHVRNVGEVLKNDKGIHVCPVTLYGSSYTYILNAGSRLFEYELGMNATITGCKK